MAGKKHGKDAYFAIEDSAATTLRDVGQYCDNIEFPRTVDMAESTTIGLESKTWLPGLDGASIQLSGKWDSAATTGPDPVLAGNIAAKVSVTWNFGPEGNAAAAVKYSGEGYVEAYQVSAPLEGIVKFTATVRVDGPVVRGVFP